MKSSELIERYRPLCHDSAGELVLPPSLAMQLVDDAHADGIAITGVEMVRMRGTAIVPDLDWIADFSSAFEPGHEAVTETTAAARKFIESLPREPAVRVIIGLVEDPA